MNPERSTVVAWYERLPAGLDRLVARIQALAAAHLGAAFAARDPAQVHATLIGLERAPDPFDPEPLAAHLHAVLAPPLTIQFGGFAPSDRRMLSRGLPLHDRGFGLRDGRAVLMGWPIVDGDPCAALAGVRTGCASFGVTHRYGRDPDLYLVVGDVAASPPDGSLEATVRAELSDAAVRVTLSADDLSLVTYDDPALPRASSAWRPLRTPSGRPRTPISVADPTACGAAATPRRPAAGPGR
ncbi:MAG: hypothetical protein QOK35_2656, partial [Pseudonocardiales bacterium]|nr:hypothetical protein [Pseudonocardiales bacterium]